MSIPQPENSLKAEDARQRQAHGGTVGSASQAVNVYLAYLNEHEPVKGRPPKSSAELAEDIGQETNFARKLILIQRHLEALDREADAQRAPRREENFVRHAKLFGDHYGITWAAWRSMGVPAAVLRQAGIEGTETEPRERVSRTPTGQAKRHKMTMEHAREIMAVYEAAGGDERTIAQNGSQGRRKGNLAVATEFGYAIGYVSAVVTDARARLAGQPTRKDQEAAARRALQASSPEPLAADTG